MRLTEYHHRARLHLGREQLGEIVCSELQFGLHNAETMLCGGTTAPCHVTQKFGSHLCLLSLYKSCARLHLVFFFNAKTNLLKSTYAAQASFVRGVDGDTAQ